MVPTTHMLHKSTTPPGVTGNTAMSTNNSKTEPPSTEAPEETPRISPGTSLPVPTPKMDTPTPTLSPGTHHTTQLKMELLPNEWFDNIISVVNNNET